MTRLAGNTCQAATHSTMQRKTVTMTYACTVPLGCSAVQCFASCAALHVVWLVHTPLLRHAAAAMAPGLAFSTSRCALFLPLTADACRLQLHGNCTVHPLVPQACSIYRRQLAYCPGPGTTLQCNTRL